MIINNMKVPPFLLVLLADGRWKRPDNINLVREVTMIDDAENFRFFDLESMEANTDGLIRLYQSGYAETLGLDSSAHRRTPITTSELLDVDKSIVIAATYSDSYLCLDYRFNLQKPSVIATVWGLTSVQWTTIATTIEDLADKLEI